jgi:glycosyltransferase involved in cell wall biosynthesis
VQHVHNARITCIQPFLVRDGAACHDCVGRAPVPGIVHRCYRDSLVHSVAATAVQLTHRRAWQRAARYVAVSDAVADTLRASNAVAADRVRVCHNGLDADPGARPPRADEGYALYVGRLSYEKGVDLLLDAAAHVPGTRFVIVGDGPARDSLARRAPANVAFRGHLDRAGVLAAIGAARALVAPSRGEEPFGLGVIEAAALGVPAVVTRVGGMPEIVRDGETGVVVAPYDAGAIATAVAALDAPRAQTLGAAARREYERRFTPDAFADRLLAIYDEVLGR